MCKGETRVFPCPIQVCIVKASASLFDKEKVLFVDSNPTGKLLLNNMELHNSFNLLLLISNPIFEKEPLHDSANDCARLTVP